MDSRLCMSRKLTRNLSCRVFQTPWSMLMTIRFHFSTEEVFATAWLESCQIWSSCTVGGVKLCRLYRVSYAVLYSLHLWQLDSGHDSLKGRVLGSHFPVLVPHFNQARRKRCISIILTCTLFSCEQLDTLPTCLFYCCLVFSKIDLLKPAKHCWNVLKHLDWFSQIIHELVSHSWVMTSFVYQRPAVS